MWPDRVSNPGPLTYESGALPTSLRGPAVVNDTRKSHCLLVIISVIFFVLRHTQEPGRGPVGWPT